MLYLIDHGAALYFHHNWPTPEPPWRRRPEPLPRRPRPRAAPLGEPASRRPTPPAPAADDEALFARIVEQIPDDWLSPDPGAADAAERRAGYVDFLTRRLEAAPLFVEEAVRARAQLV